MLLLEVEIGTYSSGMSNSKTIFALVLLATGCLPEPANEQFDESSITLDEEPILFVYDEASASIGIGVDIEELAARVQGSTIEIQVDVITPDGIRTRHDLDWTSGDERALAGFGVPALSNGLYEFELTRLAIDGETIDGMTARASMRLLGVRDDGQAGGQNDGCKKGDKIKGTSKSDELYGTKNNDEILGEEGADTLYGKECHDILRGGKAHDELHGGKGKDELHGGKGSDECYGGQGSDMFFGCEKVHQD
jgi:Ca2+-binding RTX toxin-like protein